MRKTLRSFGMILSVMLIVMGVNACGEDKNDEPAQSNAKRVKAVVLTAGNETEEQSYEYDSSGRIISAAWRASDGDYETYSYTYDPSKIVAKCSDGFVETYYLNDGLVSKYTQDGPHSSSETSYYFYDSERKLVRIKNEFGSAIETQNVEWKDDNIVAIEGSTYTYSDIPFEKGYNIYHNIDWVLYSQGYFGKCSRNLYSSETRNHKTDEYRYDIKDGYVVKTSINNSIFYTISWK